MRFKWDVHCQHCHKGNREERAIRFQLFGWTTATRQRKHPGHISTSSGSWKPQQQEPLETSQTRDKLTHILGSKFDYCCLSFSAKLTLSLTVTFVRGEIPSLPHFSVPGLAPLRADPLRLVRAQKRWRNHCSCYEVKRLFCSHLKRWAFGPRLCCSHEKHLSKPKKRWARSKLLLSFIPLFSAVMLWSGLIETQSKVSRKPGRSGMKVEPLFGWRFWDFIYSDCALKSRIITTTCELGIKASQNELCISDYLQRYLQTWYFMKLYQNIPKILPNIMRQVWVWQRSEVSSQVSL